MAVPTEDQEETMKRIFGLAAMVLTLAMTAAAPARAADTDASKLAVAKEMITAWKVADWRKVADLFAENGSLKSMMVEPVNGRAGDL
jgi:limonene-1,2-epoxide hydrolase